MSVVSLTYNEGEKIVCAYGNICGTMQSPFVTLFLNIDENDEYAEEVALIVQEILKQRIQGIKNEKGIYTTPAFPKLIYVLHEHNAYEGGKYDYVTDIAVKCSAKRLYPDYSVTCCLDKISA